jgi:hypothetical protein
MESARYHRHQAELCLEIARQMIDRQEADRLCAAAARHFAQAIELEKQTTAGKIEPSSSRSVARISKSGRRFGSAESAVEVKGLNEVVITHASLSVFLSRVNAAAVSSVHACSPGRRPLIPLR